MTEKNNYLGAVGVAIFVISLGALVYFAFIKKSTVNTQTVVKNSRKAFISPKSFGTGYVQNSPQKLASLCGGVMYPINAPYVDYGPGPDYKCCDNLKFNAPP